MAALVDPVPQIELPSAQQAPPPSRSGWGWVVLCLAIAALIVPWIATRRWPETRTALAPVIKTAKVHRGSMEIVVRVGGQITARRYANIIAPRLRLPEADRSMGLLKLTPAGQFVHAGAMVAEFDPQAARDHLDDTRDAFHDQQNRLAKQRVQLDVDLAVLFQRLSKAKAKMEKARWDLKTLEVRSDINKELLKIAAEEAEAEFYAIEDELPLKADSQAAALRIAEISREIESLHVDRHVQDLDRLTVRSPMDGVVVLESQNRPGGERVTYEAGDRVHPGTVFMRVVDPTSMQVDGWVNQAEIGQFRVGQEASIRLDAYPEALYKGKVYAIGALASKPGRQQYYLRTIPIRVEVLNPDERLLPDLSASAEVVVERQEDVLLAPASAVKRENGEDVVYVQNETGTERRGVRARVHGTQAALMEGVQEGEVVLVQ